MSGGVPRRLTHLIGLEERDMTRRSWLWSAALAAPLALVGVVYANTQVSAGYTCPVTGENLPCDQCCPLMGAAVQETTEPETKVATEGSFICPVTGEELTCRKCCPLNKPKK